MRTQTPENGQWNKELPRDSWARKLCCVNGWKRLSYWMWQYNVISFISPVRNYKIQNSSLQPPKFEFQIVLGQVVVKWQYDDGIRRGIEDKRWNDLRDAQTRPQFVSVDFLDVRTHKQSVVTGWKQNVLGQLLNRHISGSKRIKNEEKDDLQEKKIAHDSMLAFTAGESVRQQKIDESLRRTIFC